MVKQTIEQSRGKNLVPQQSTPFRKAGVGRQDDRAFLITVAHQFKQGMRLLCGEPGVADLIDHQNTGGEVAAQPLPAQAGMRDTGQVFGEAGERS